MTQASSSLDDLSRGPEPQPAHVWRDAGLAWLDGVAGSAGAGW